MTLLDRYIFQSVLFTCAAAVGLFAFVVALPNVIRDLMGPLLAGQIELGMFAWLVALLVPFVVTYALPMGILTGVLLTLGRLSADSEVTAMRAAGLSLRRVARPVYVLGALGVVLALYINFEFMPRARVQYHRELDNAIRTNPISILVPKTFVRDFRGFVIYVGDKQGAVLRDIWVWKLDRENRVTQLVHAESGLIDYDEETNELIFTGVQAKVETREAKAPEDFSEAPPIATVARTEPWRVPLDRLFGRSVDRTKLEWLTYAQLREQRIKVEAGRATAKDAREQARAEMRVRMTVQEKFTTAFSVLAFAIVAAPLGIKVSRRETSANLGVGLGLVLSYYFLTVMVKWLDRHPEYRPDLLLWVPNILFVALAVWLLRRLERQ